MTRARVLTASPVPADGPSPASCGKDPEQVRVVHGGIRRKISAHTSPLRSSTRSWCVPRPPRPSPRFPYPCELQRGWRGPGAAHLSASASAECPLLCKRSVALAREISLRVRSLPALYESAVNAAAVCVSPENLTSSEICSPCALQSQGGCCLCVLLQMIYLALLCKRGWLLLGNLTASEISSFPVPRERRGRRCGVRPDSYGMVSCPLLRKRRVDCCLGHFTAREISFCPVLCKRRVVAAREISL